jgi:hypothetical protein
VGTQFDCRIFALSVHRATMLTYALPAICATSEKDI